MHRRGPGASEASQVRCGSSLGAQPAGRHLSSLRGVHQEPHVDGILPSTTWRSTRVKVSPAPQATGTARRSRSTWKGRSPWRRRDKLTLKIHYRGGPECWFEIEARGLTGRFIGSDCLYDVMRVIWNDGRE